MLVQADFIPSFQAKRDGWPRPRNGKAVSFESCLIFFPLLGVGFRSKRILDVTEEKGPMFSEPDCHSAPACGTFLDDLISA